MLVRNTSTAREIRPVSWRHCVNGTSTLVSPSASFCMVSQSDEIGREMLRATKNAMMAAITAASHASPPTQYSLWRTTSSISSI